MNVSKNVFGACLFVCSFICHAEPASVTLYLLGYDIPQEQRQIVVEQDIAALAQYQKKRSQSHFWHQEEVASPKITRNNFPFFSTAELTLCNASDLLACLAYIHNDPEPYHQSMQRLAPVLEDIEALEASDRLALKSIFPDNLRLTVTPFPDYAILFRVLYTRDVLSYEDNPSQGLTQICSTISFAKALIGSEESIVQSLIGNHILLNELELLSSTSQLLPTSCRQALTPMPASQITICPLIQKEHQSLANELMVIPDIPLLYNDTMTIKQHEAHIQAYCTQDWQTKVAHDEFVERPDMAEEPIRIVNLIGSILASVAIQSDYSTYQRRLLDGNAYLRLWQAVLDPECAKDPAQYLASIAPQWQTSRALRLDAQKRLTITLYDQRQRKEISLSCQHFQ